MSYYNHQNGAASKEADIVRSMQLDHTSMLGKEATNAAILVPIVGFVIDLYRKKELNPRTMTDLAMLTAIIIMARQSVDKAGSFIDGIRLDKFYYIRYFFLRLRYGVKQYAITIKTPTQSDSSNKNQAKKYLWIKQRPSGHPEEIKINETSLQSMVQNYGSININHDNGSFYFQMKHNIVVSINIKPDTIIFYVPNHHQYITKFDEIMEKELVINTDITVADVFIMAIDGRSPKFTARSKITEGKKFVFFNQTYTNLIGTINRGVACRDATQGMQTAGCYALKGPPGLGKTFFIECYASTEGSFTTILIVRMETMVNITSSSSGTSPVACSLAEIFKAIEANTWPGKGQTGNDGNPIPLKILLVLDEIDKYLEKYIRAMIEKERKENTKVKEASTGSGKGKDGQDQQVTNITTIQEKLTEEEITNIRILHKTEFCNALKGLWDGNFLPSFTAVTLLMNVNDFDTMFSEVDENLVSATKDRISVEEIKKLDAANIVQYLEARIKHINTYSKTVKFEITPKQIETIKKMKIDMSYRTINKLLDRCLTIDDLIKTMDNPMYMKRVENESDGSD